MLDTLMLMVVLYARASSTFDDFDLFVGQHHDLTLLANDNIPFFRTDLSSAGCFG